MTERPVHVNPHTLPGMSPEEADSIVRPWYDGELGDPPLEPLLDRKFVARYFGLDPEQVPDSLFHATPEDPYSPPNATEFLTHVMEMDTTLVPDCGGWFDLRSGILRGVPILVGNGRFDSSFPLLIFRQSDEWAVQLEYNAFSGAVQ